MLKKIVSIAVAAMVSLSLVSVKSYAKISEKAESLKNGTYKVNVSLVKENSEEASMADAALEREAKLVVKDGVKTIDITFKPLQMFGINGHLTSLQYFNSEEDYKKFYPSENKDLLNDVKVISQYEDEDLNGETKNFIQTVEFNLPSNEDEIYLHTKVDAMSNSDGSGGYADVKLKIDYSNIEIVNLGNEDAKLKDGIYEVPFKVYTRRNKKEYTWMSNFFDGKAKVQVKDGKMKAYFNILENNDSEWIKSLIAHFDMTSNDETGIQFITEETVERTYNNGEKENFPSLMSLEFPEMQKEVLIGVNTKIPTTQDRINRDWCRFLMDFDNMKFVNNLDDNKEDNGEKVEDTTGKKDENTEVNDNNKENETVLNKDNLNDGRYEVQLYLWNATKDAASMANDCFNHTALIDIKDGVKTISFTTKPMIFAGITANLDTLQYKDNTGNYVDAAVINTDENGKPNAFSFVLPSTEDYIDVMVNPHVAMMGNKPIAARLKIDYSTLKKAEGSVLDITKENTIESKNNDAAIILNSSEVQAPAAGDNDVISGNTVLVKTGDSMGKVLVITAISLMALAYTLENRSKRNLNKSN